MDKKHVIALLPAYLDDLLDKDQAQNIEAHLKNCAACSEELKDLQTLFKAIQDEEQFTPSDKIRTNFFDQIELEKQSQSKVVSIKQSSARGRNSWSNYLLKIAASVVLLVGAYFLGKQQQQQISGQEIAQLTNETKGFKQTAMLSLMENKSVSKRIQGVNFIQEFNEPDEAIVKALADRMLHDENVNVRIAAVEVLANFTSSESVKNTFIKALKTEKDPGIQIAIIQTLGQIQEKKAILPMQNLLENEETQPFVKKQIQTVLPNII